jgi:hypothetical protein
MEEKQVENFIRKFERHTFWKRFNEGVLIGMFRSISFYMTFCCIVISLFYIIERRTDQIESFSLFFLTLFTFFAFINTEFFKEETIEGINVPEFEKFLEENELYGMKIDSRIVNEFLEEEKVELIEKLNE